MKPLRRPGLYGRLTRIERVLFPRIERQERRVEDSEAILIAADVIQRRQQRDSSYVPSEEENALLRRAAEVWQRLAVAQERQQQAKTQERG